MAGTIQEIAEKAGVSRGTVDRALNNRGRVNSDVAERIYHIAEDIGYVSPKQRKMIQQSIKIGVLIQLAKASFVVQIKKGIEDAEKALRNRNIELIIEEVLTVNEDEQLIAIDRLASKGVSGIALMPVECDSVRNKLNQLADKGIHIVTFNSDIVGTKRSCFVGLDNIKSGRTAAGLMGMMTGGTGRVLAITGYFTNSVNSMRVDGFIDEVKKSFPNLELVGIQCSFDESKEVQKIIENTLSTYQDLEGIVVFSGGQSGIERAFKSSDLTVRPHTIVYDMTPENINALEDGTVDFLIDQNGYMQGYRALNNLADILQNQKRVEEYQFTEIIIKTKYNL